MAPDIFSLGISSVFCLISSFLAVSSAPAILSLPVEGLASVPEPVLSFNPSPSEGLADELRLSVAVPPSPPVPTPPSVFPDLSG